MNNNNNQNSPLRDIAKWVVKLSLNDIPERVQDKVRYQCLNVISSQHAAQHHSGALQAKEAILAWGKSGNCTVIPTGEKLPLHEAVLVNAINSMALDYDDYLYMGHTGHSAVVASWALCEELNLPLQDLVTMAVIGNEIGGRLGITTALGPQNGQAWSYIHNLAAAAIAAKAYSLNELQTEHALAIALYQPGFTLWPGFMGADSKLLTAAWPTVQGIQAAQFALKGMTGAQDIIDHPNKGFWKFFTYTSVPHMLSGLGKSWLSDTLTFKKYPGCAYIDTSMDSLFHIMSEHHKRQGVPLKSADIKSIHIKANLLTIEMDNLSREYWNQQYIPQTTANFSIPISIAIGLLNGKLTGKELDQVNLDIHQDALFEITQKVTLEHSWNMTLQVIEDINECLGQQSLSSALTIKQWLAIIRGYRSQLGGQRHHSLRLRSLLKSWRQLVRLLLNKPKKPKQLDLGLVDFSNFKMSFPVEVTVQLNSREKHTYRQDIPYGAQAQKYYFQTVIEKYFAEAGDDEHHMNVIRHITNKDLMVHSNIKKLTDLVARAEAKHPLAFEMA